MRTEKENYYAELEEEQNFLEINFKNFPLKKWEIAALNSKESHELFNNVFKEMASDFRISGHEYGIKLCCVIFFNHCYVPKLKEFIGEYHPKISNKTGIIPCPDCLADLLFPEPMLILELKKGKKEEESIIRITKSKFGAFSARINFMKRNKEENKIDLFDLAGESKRRLQVYRLGEKYLNQHI